ncbi:MAG: SRPBCC domain-containing protein [Chloroflexi bacterium]|nr:SRPBCC domain-containing protein [Chloroflexota bacterium]MCC6894534.1 SRPBCC domain-containing protein [Anaerolineae bacterium]
MPEPLHIQIALNAPPEHIFRALTDELPAWFAEFADVSLADQHYDFWGRFTPGTPDREAGKHPLSDVQVGQSYRYDWTLNNEPTQVRVQLLPQNERTLVVIQHVEMNPEHAIGTNTNEDFWFLSLENLRRHLDGKPPVRCDFSTLPSTGDVHHTVEVDAAPDVVFEALIKPEQLNRWITSNAKIEPHVGGAFDLGWSGVAPLKILELVPNEKIAYQWEEAADAPATVVTWTLEGSGGKTRVTLVHSGFAPDTPTGGIQSGWLNFASWLKSLSEYGADWEPAIKRLTPELQPFYPGIMGTSQSKLEAVT